MIDRARYLLLQVRNAEDPMRGQEVRCFARALGCEAGRIAAVDLLRGGPSRAQVDSADVVLLGGSGEYSVAAGGPWLGPALEAMADLHAWSKPTFASCWGFQAMARAMGGRVVTDLSRAELGTLPVRLTEAGRSDPVFGTLGCRFSAQMGHQDIVDALPADAELLASTDRVAHQAFRFVGRPIYCTQFHPELDRRAMLERVRTYPQYVRRIAGLTMERFERSLHDTPDTRHLLRRFVEAVLDGF